MGGSETRVKRAISKQKYILDCEKKLRHDRMVGDYMKRFGYLILDIDNMFEEDKFFDFLPRLQSWAQLELRRQKV